MTTKKNEAEVRRIVDNACWESAGMGGHLRCKDCGCYKGDKKHWKDDCAYAELLEIVDKAYKEI